MAELWHVRNAECGFFVNKCRANPSLGRDNKLLYLLVMPRSKGNPRQSSRKASSASGSAKNNAATKTLDEEATFFLTTPGLKAIGIKKRSASATPVKRGRPRKGANTGGSSLAKTSALVDNSSEFESPSPKKRSRRNKSPLEVKKEDEASDEEADEDDEDEEEESEKEAQLTRTRTAGPPIRINVRNKVERLRHDPQFVGIRSETLNRIVEQFDRDESTPSVIINTTVNKPVPRRKAVRWTDDETEYANIYFKKLAFICFVGIYARESRSMGVRGGTFLLILNLTSMTALRWI